MMIPYISQTYEEDIDVHIVTLWWRTETIGAAIIIAVGDDEADFTWGDANKQYGQSEIKFKLSEGLPEEAQEILAQVHSAWEDECERDFDNRMRELSKGKVIGHIVGKFVPVKKDEDDKT